MWRNLVEVRTVCGGVEVDGSPMLDVVLLENAEVAGSAMLGGIDVGGGSTVLDELVVGITLW